MKIPQRFGAVSLVVGLLMVACAQDKTPPPPSKRPRGHLLFIHSETAAKIAELKTDFLQKEPIVKDLNSKNVGTHTIDYYNLNASRNAANENAPLSPVVHNYHRINPLSLAGSIDPNVPLTASFPYYFFNNILPEMKTLIENRDIDSLDVMFAPQLAIEGSTVPASQTYKDTLLANAAGVIDVSDQLSSVSSKASLKPAFWADPKMPALGAVSGTRYSEELLMSIFDSNIPIDDQVVTNKLKPFGISVHDGKISGDVGHLNIELKDLNVSFWSLVISKKQAKAVVTLHWILDQATYTALMLHIQAAGNGHLENLVESLEKDHTFTTDPAANNPNAHLLNKLKSLVRVN